ncbi:MAG: HIT domain-containing protein [Bacteroidales bacterium]|nr:HIT domain-containing protein [Bacteroidales bacterium]MCF8454324.1 HIT domain-containing protein [Bacteroidales bacterium]
MKNPIPNCPFCATDIAAISFYETENFRTIYNRSPILPGHSLLIPKRHFESLLDFSDAELSEIMIHAKQAIQLLLKAFNCKGFNLSLQEKEEAGQSVAHFHLHIIPRKEKDLHKPGDWYPKLIESELIDSEERQKLSHSEMIKMAEFIKKAAKIIRK